MNAPSLDQIRARIQLHRGRFPDISRLSGLSYSLICKIAQGHRTNPTFDTVRALVGALDRLDAQAADSAAPAEKVA